MNLERLYVEALDLSERGRAAEAEVLFRTLAARGDVDAMRGLGDLLTNEEGARRREGLAWYRRATGLGDGRAAWNCAMSWRLRGDRRRYLRWVETSARLGYANAAVVLAEINRRRAGGRTWPMFKTDLTWIDPEDIVDMLQAFLDGEVTAAEVRAWADGVACGDLLATPELRERRRLKPILEELATGGLQNTRARELLFALNPD